MSLKQSMNYIHEKHKENWPGETGQRDVQGYVKSDPEFLDKLRAIVSESGVQNHLEDTSVSPVVREQLKGIFNMLWSAEKASDINWDFIGAVFYRNKEW